MNTWYSFELLKNLKIILWLKKMILSVLVIGIFATAFSNDDNNEPTTASLTLNLNGLKALGNDYVYLQITSDE